MRRWKKILSASLVAVMVGSLGMTAFAEDTSANEPIDTTVSNYNLTEEETSGKNQEEIKALQQQKIDEVTQQAYDMKIASNELENWRKTGYLRRGWDCHGGKKRCNPLCEKH